MTEAESGGVAVEANAGREKSSGATLVSFGHGWEESLISVSDSGGARNRGLEIERRLPSDQDD